MTRFKSWNEYATERAANEGKEPTNESKDTKKEFIHLSKTPEEQNATCSGEPLDLTYREEDEYKKMLDFLRGKKNVPDPPKPPAEAPKGWFIADEQSRGFWYDNGWTQDTSFLNEAVIDSERAAHALAQVVGGVVIPAEEVMGN